MLPFECPKCYSRLVTVAGWHSVQKNNTSSRIAVVHNPTSESAHLLHTEVQMALQQRKPHEVVTSVLEGTKLDIKEVSKVSQSKVQEVHT